MSGHFNQEIDNLKSTLNQMALLVDEQVEQAIRSLETGNVEMCKGIKARDAEVDAFDNRIQQQCENILALFQPVAVDLRFLISAMMINNQLERCGDIAVNIAQRVKKTGEQHQLIVETRIVEMGKQAREMLKESITCFLKNDVELANSVRKKDDIVDQLNRDIFKLLIQKMQSDPGLVETGAHLIVLTRHIERLADHSTNIAENVIFYVNADIVSHEWTLKNKKE